MMKKLILFFATATTLLFAQSYKIGDEVKDFSLKNVDGKMVAMKDFSKAKGILVIFTCNHCPFSVAYEQRIMNLDVKYRPLGYPVIAINPNDPAIVPDDSYENMVRIAQEKGYTFPYLFDETQEVAKAFGAAKTPHVFLLNKTKSKWILEYMGAIDNNSDDATQADKKYTEDAVDALLAGKKPAVTETKAIGCGVKWKK
jgi:peroxiredoxin